jgi:Arc/MetJ-type ribon-helix-helix transcriptional regulator
VATREKLAITLPKDLVETIRAEVKARRAPSVSALIAEALEEKYERDRLQEVLDEMDAEYGPVTPEVLEWAKRVLTD